MGKLTRRLQPRQAPSQKEATDEYFASELQLPIPGGLLNELIRRRLKRTDLLVYMVVYYGTASTNEELSIAVDASTRNITSSISRLTKLGYLQICYEEGMRCLAVVPFPERCGFPGESK